MTGAAEDHQVVIFGLGTESFALPVAQVREILDHRPCFRMPHMPAWILGLTDIRGQSVPVVDLRRRLGMAPVETTPTTRVLVTEFQPKEGAGLQRLGLVVDRVLDVSLYDAGAVESPPAIGGRWRSECVAAILRHKGDFAALLDLASIFAEDDPAMLDGTALASAIAA